MRIRRQPSIQRTVPVGIVAGLALVAAACGGATGAADRTASASGAAVATPAAVATAAPLPSAATTSALGGGAGPGAATVAMPGPAPELAGLVNADGSDFDLARYEGSNLLLFFGYTHCPDVCPATIGELFGVFKALPDTQAVFISVDPERDTPAFLAEWTQYFPENFHAVTGTPGAIRRAADDYGVRYARVETTSTAGYTMSHTADVYLIDRHGQLLRRYPFGTPAAQMIADLDELGAA